MAAIKALLLGLALGLSLPAAASPASADPLEPLVESFTVLRARVAAERPGPVPPACEGERCAWYREVEHEFTDRVRLAPPCVLPVCAMPRKTEVAKLDLGALLNRQYKTRIVRRLNRRDIWLSGLFSRERIPYTTVLVDGFLPRVFDSRGLVWRSGRFTFDGRDYKISISPNIFNKLESKVWVEDLADASARFSITARDMFLAFTATAEPVTLHGRLYHVMYFDAVNERLEPDPRLKTLAFIHLDAGRNPNLFLIPVEDLAQAKTSVYQLYQGQPAGLELSGGALRIYAE